MNVLVQETELDTPGTNYVSSIRRLFTPHKSENGALSGTVSTNESYVLSGVYLQRCTAQNILDTV
jgi:hypothetical protein